MSIPYEKAEAGAKARDEIVKLLRKFGCESVGFMDDFAEHSVILAFRHRGRPIQLRASAQGWANLYLKENPHTSRHKGSKDAYHERALRQGSLAINSILRDWVKGQITAIETGILSFEAVFMPFMLTRDGRSLGERAQELIEIAEKQSLLPAP